MSLETPEAEDGELSKHVCHEDDTDTAKWRYIPNKVDWHRVFAPTKYTNTCMDVRYRKSKVLFTLRAIGFGTFGVTWACQFK